MNAIAKPLPWYKRFGPDAKPGRLSEQQARDYADWLLSYQRRPWDWVLACYPWGEEGSPLQNRVPELWQRERLKEMQAELQALPPNSPDTLNHVLRVAVAAGNGVGKSAFIAWIIHWYVSCFPNGQAVITAGTETQLQTKTWLEVSKWRAMAINGWQTKWTATRYMHVDNPETWFAAAVPWSAANAAAFAGTHERYVLVVFDEASAIDKVIWETVEGALTTGLCIFIAFGNPTETEGGFYDAFHGKDAASWKRSRVDARSVTFANHKELTRWIETWGADSDFVRIHVYGQFPRQSSLSFIDSAVVRSAMDRTIDMRDIPQALPRIMGVDLARQGVDLNAICRRQGRKVWPFEPHLWSERDTIKTANYIARVINEWRPAIVFIDGVGVGGGVVDYLRRIGFSRVVVDCQSGIVPPIREDAKRYANMRATIWARMREALPYLDLPDDPQLAEELCAPKFDFRTDTQKMVLESKKEMQSRGVASPNKADALALTYWSDVPLVGSNVTGGFVEPEEV